MTMRKLIHLIRYKERMVVERRYMLIFLSEDAKQIEEEIDKIKIE